MSKQKGTLEEFIENNREKIIDCMKYGLPFLAAALMLYGLSNPLKNSFSHDTTTQEDSTAECSEHKQKITAFETIAKSNDLVKNLIQAKYAGNIENIESVTLDKITPNMYNNNGIFEPYEYYSPIEIFYPNEHKWIADPNSPFYNENPKPVINVINIALHCTITTDNGNKKDTIMNIAVPTETAIEVFKAFGLEEFVLTENIVKYLKNPQSAINDLNYVAYPFFELTPSVIAGSTEHQLQAINKFLEDTAQCNLYPEKQAENEQSMN